MARLDLRVDLLDSPSDVAAIAAAAAHLVCDVDITVDRSESGAPQWSARVTQDAPDFLSGQLARLVMLRALLERSSPEQVLTRLRHDLTSYGVPLDRPPVIDLSASTTQTPEQAGAG